MSNKVRLTVAGILAGMAINAAPTPPPTTIPFSFNVSASEPAVLNSMGAFPNQPVYTGTCGTLGACQADWANDNSIGIGSSITFTVADGSSLTATLSSPPFISGPNSTILTVVAFVLGGTGMFTNATGSFPFVQTVTNVIPSPANTYTAALTGSGAITISPGGGVTEAPSKLQLISPKGSTAPLLKSLALTNTGSTAEPFTASASVTSKSSWLSVSTSQGTVPAGGSASIQVTADPSKLAPGVYNGEVDLDVSGGAVVVPVLFVVGNSGGNLQLSQTGLSFSATLGGSSPASETVQVSNTGIGTLSGLTVTTTVTGSESNWLHASIATGYSTQTQTTVSITADPGKLPTGTFYGQVNFNLPNTLNAPQSVSVQMTVGAGALPTITPADFIFVITGDTNTGMYNLPANQNVTITNPGLSNLDFNLTYNLGPYPAPPPWLAFTPTSGTIPPGGNMVIQFSMPQSFLTNPFIGEITTFYSAALIDINFPSIYPVACPTCNYTPFVRAQVALGAGSSALSIPPWGTPPPGAPLPGAARPARPKIGPPGPCTPTGLVTALTSVPVWFQGIVGQPAPLEAEIIDNCGNNVDSGSVSATFSTGESSVNLNSEGNGQWAATWTPRLAGANVVITLQAVSDAGLVGSGTTPGSVLASTSTPIIGAGGIVNAASGAPVIAPGAFIAIYGANMGGGVTTASKVPFPTSLGTTQVFLGDQSLPLFFTSAQQIDAIVPYDIAPNSSQQLIVQTGDALSQPENVIVAAAQPGVFTQNQSGSGPGAILGQKPGGVAALNTASNPASAGDALLIFCTGLGAVTPPVTAGAAASSTKLSNTDNPVTVTVGGKDAQVLFAGLAPGYVGLYQVNVIVPSGIAAAADVPVVLTEAGATSAPVTVAVK
jgi:uncharacterized protein (TIGR03437 family)